MVDPPLAFEPLRRADFPLVSRWLAEPLVARWWDDDSSEAGLEQHYGPSIDGVEPAEVFIATYDGRAFGLIQRFFIHAYPEYVTELAPVCDVPLDALSIDYLIGEPDLRGQGLGARLIGEFVRSSWAARPPANSVIVPVAAGNVASWRALERAGFRRIAVGELTPDNPIDPRDHVIYRIDRSGEP